MEEKKFIGRKIGEVGGLGSHPENSFVYFRVDQILSPKCGNDPRSTTSIKSKNNARWTMFLLKITDGQLVVETTITGIENGLLSVYFARKEGDRRVERATWNPELIIGEKRDWLQRHRRKSKRRLAAREKTGGGPFKTECADRSTRMNLGPIPASRVFFPPSPTHLSDRTSFVSRL